MAVSCCHCSFNKSIAVACLYQRHLLLADGHYAHVLIGQCFAALRYNVSFMQDQHENIASAAQFLRSAL